jgi:hypothetical protein
VVLTVLFIVWLGFQLFAQASLFEWIGDRIDNLTDNFNNNDDEGGIGLMIRSVSTWSR